jgi:hypothetical protein
VSSRPWHGRRRRRDVASWADVVANVTLRSTFTTWFMVLPRGSRSSARDVARFSTQPIDEARGFEVHPVGRQTQSPNEGKASTISNLRHFDQNNQKARNTLTRTARTGTIYCADRQSIVWAGWHTPMSMESGPRNCVDSDGLVSFVSCRAVVRPR